MSTIGDELLVAGVIGAARGLKGEVAVTVRTDRPEVVLAPGETVLTSSDRFPALTISHVGAHAGRTYLRFEGVGSREEAEALRGVELLVPPTSEEDAWYPSELVGLAAVTADGQPLGRVKALAPGAAHDLLVVDAGVDVWVPFVKAIVTEVSVGDQRVIIDAPEGLFPSGEDAVPVTDTNVTDTNESDSGV